ncbi:hypothetical protein H6F43_05990 [Leptolyngbya sp. FACHB-36]|uniref:hypothetical protein n=1 Tax=Leptolyngbya sp. FACHB-36 TaxID=2692808 RepID=UPI0016809DA8|nr:hypothetical protein [Leptolyngbya sp. FACHB-36]MBD2019738.1 hypothetical protein [Leptolyngbya sp. FACHB-36]
MSDNTASVGALSKQLLSQLPEDSAIWNSLKQAIATSSGFRRWQLERNVDGSLSGMSLDHSVRYYLRETLETLAY